MRIHFGRRIGKFYVGSSADAGSVLGWAGIILLIPLCVYGLIVWPIRTVIRWAAHDPELSLGSKVFALAIVLIEVSALGLVLYDAVESVGYEPLNAYEIRGEVPPTFSAAPADDYYQLTMDVEDITMPETAPELAPEPTPAAVVMVWVSDGGSKYHRKSTCSGMESSRQVTLDEAKSMGRTACKVCY